MDDIKLLIGIFEMKGINTPQILDTLTKYNLKYIPEAHTYLKYQNQGIQHQPYRQVGVLVVDIDLDKATGLLAKRFKSHLFL